MTQTRTRSGWNRAVTGLTKLLFGALIVVTSLVIVVGTTNAWVWVATGDLAAAAAWLVVTGVYVSLAYFAYLHASSLALVPYWGRLHPPATIVKRVPDALAESDAAVAATIAGALLFVAVVLQACLTIPDMSHGDTVAVTLVSSGLLLLTVPPYVKTVRRRGTPAPEVTADG